MPPTNPIAAGAVPSLTPSRYDRVASLLISTLILSGTSVAMLFVVWLGTQRDSPRTSQPIWPVDEHGEHFPAESSELDTPQLAELSEAQLLDPVVELSTLLSSNAIAVAAQLDTDSITAAGPGKPGGRCMGPPPKELVPRWERWEIRYEASSLKGYAMQLDYFGIELGAVGRTPLVDYASHFTDATPMTRSGSGSDEQRLYLSWRGGRLQAMDRELLDKAGIDVAGRSLLQFYPPEIEQTLARLEIEHTKDGRADKVRKTIFGVRRSEDGYEFFVIEQR